MLIFLVFSLPFATINFTYLLTLLISNMLLVHMRFSLGFDKNVNIYYNRIKLSHID